MPRFDSTVNPTHILTVIGMAAAVAISYSTLDKRLAVVEEAKAAQAAELGDMKRNTREDLKAINDKLDKIIAGLSAAQAQQQLRSR